MGEYCISDHFTLPSEEKKEQGFSSPEEIAAYEAEGLCCLLVLADRFAVPRLVALCELYISKAIERATADSISKSPLDISGVVMTAQHCNAMQLFEFGMHFLRVNFQAPRTAMVPSPLLMILPGSLLLNSSGPRSA